MACYVTKDPDNIWYVPIKWDNWFTGQIDEMGGTFTIVTSLWFPETGIAEVGSAFDDSTKIASFYGSGGVDQTNYTLMNRITFTSTSPTLVGQTFSEDRTIEVRIREK